MSLSNYFHFHSFFKNKELNHMYVSFAIMVFAETLLSIFVPIYLFTIGYSIPKIIFFFFLVSLSFVIFSYLGAKIVAYKGVKHAILFSVPFMILYYIGLQFIESLPILFYILPIFLSWKMILFNYGYHINYITHSNKKKRGREISFLYTLVITVAAIAPLVGGVIASTLGFSILYMIGSAILFLGTIPLFLTKDNYERIKFSQEGLFKKIFRKKNRGTLISFSGYAIEASVGGVIWPIFLITILATVSKTGLIVTLSMVTSIFLFYFIGKMTDKYDKIKIIKKATIFYSIAWIARIFATTSTRIFFIDSYKNITEKILHVPWIAKTYDIASKEGYFQFLVSREVIFNLSRVIFLPFIILVFSFASSPFIITFIIAAIFTTGYAFLGNK